MCEEIMSIIDREWPMFTSVNGEDKVSCQENKGMFVAMRRAQFMVWSPEARESYLNDLIEAEKAGRNLIREKYIHMMKSTDINGYNHFIKEIPAPSQEKTELIEAIWNIMEKQTDNIRKEYPFIALGGRPFHACEECNGSTSVETYQKGELLTYSENTLKALLGRIRELESQGVEMAREILKNTIICQGFDTLEHAEEAMGELIREKIASESCCCCGAE